MRQRNPGPTQKDREKQALTQKLENMTPAAVPTGTPFYDDFDSYLKDYPQGEPFRRWLTNDGRHAVSLLQVPNLHDNALPGHYLAVTISEHRDWADKTGKTRVVQLTLRDSDDGIAIRIWPAEQRDDADKLLVEMKQLAPFTMGDAIKVFGLKAE